MRTDSFAFIVLLGALAALPPLSIDTGLPAFGYLQAGLGVSAAQAAWTLSIFMAGFGCAQIIVGPLSDRFGRRPVMLTGLALFTASGLGCALAPSIEVLLFFRLLCGIGAAGSSTLALAVARDLFEGHDARVKLSAIATVTTVAPMIGPTLGGLLLIFGEWRFIYAFLCAAGVVQFVLAYLLLAETRPPQVGAKIAILGRYAAVLRVRRTVGYAMVNGFGSAGMFSYIAVSSLLLMGDMGASVSLFAILFATTSGGIMLGAQINAALARRRVRAQIPLAIAQYCAPVAALTGLVVLATGPSLLAFVPTVVVFCICRGLANPNGTHAAMERVPTHAGTAASLLGCTQMMSAAAAGGIVAALHPLVGPVATGIGMLGCSLASLFVWRWVERTAP